MNTPSEVNPEEGTVLAVSIDFDGAYSRLTSPCVTLKELVEYNPMLYLFCIEKIEQHGKLIVLTGSNRQSPDIDYTNLILKGKHGSCFDALRYFTYTLGEKASFDTITTSDVIRGLPMGSTIERYLKEVELYKEARLGKRPPEEEEEDYLLTIADATMLHENPNIHDLFEREVNTFIDKNKIMLIYLQMHRIASQFPTSNIIFSFFDDEIEIFDALSNFFNQYKVWIPYNLRLDLHRYSEDTIVEAYNTVQQGQHPPVENLPHACIEGSGPIDHDYANSFLMIQDMIRTHILKTLGENPDPAKLKRKLNSPIEASKHLTEEDVKQIVMKPKGLQIESRVNLSASGHGLFKGGKIMASEAANPTPPPLPSLSSADRVDN